MDNQNDIEIQGTENLISNNPISLPTNFITIGNIESDDVRIYIKQNVYLELEKYSSADVEHERGTILIGDFCENMGKTSVIICDFIEAKYTDASASTLTFTHETWNYVNKVFEEKYSGKKIIGWQHTHPGYGIFLSNYDIFIHENFFNLPFQIAYVIDPKQNYRGFFQWKNNKIEKLKGFCIYDEVGKKIKIEEKKKQKEEQKKNKLKDKKTFKEKMKDPKFKLKIAIISASSVLVIVILIFAMTAFYVPNFDKMSVKELDEAIKYKAYSVSYEKDEYKNGYNKDIIYNQDIEPGSFNFGCKKVQLKVSLGNKYKIPKYSGCQYSEIKDKLKHFNIDFKYKHSSTDDKGEVISIKDNSGEQLYENDLVNENSKITVYICKGHVANVIGYKLSDAKKEYKDCTIKVVEVLDDAVKNKVLKVNEN